MLAATDPKLESNASFQVIRRLMRAWLRPPQEAFMFLAASPRLLLSSSRRRPVTGEMKDSSSFLSSRVIRPCLMPGGRFALIHGVHAPGRLRQMLIALNVGHQRPAEAGGSVCQSSAKNNPLRGNGRGLQALWRRGGLAAVMKQELPT